MANGGKQRWDAMTVREYVDGQGQNRSFWTKIGAAFTNQDGSISVQLDALPLDGRVILQIPLSKEERQARFGQRQQGGAGGGGWGQPRGQQQRGAPQQRGQQRYRGQPVPSGNLFNQQGNQPAYEPEAQPQQDQGYPGEWDDQGDEPPFK